VKRCLATLSSCTRRTDCIGWIDEGKTIGILFTGIDVHQQKFCDEVFEKKVRRAGFIDEKLTCENSRIDQDWSFARPRSSVLQPLEGLEGGVDCDHLRYCRDGVRLRTALGEAPMAHGEAGLARLFSHAVFSSYGTVEAQAAINGSSATESAHYDRAAHVCGSGSVAAAQNDRLPSGTGAMFVTAEGSQTFNWREELEWIRRNALAEQNPVGGRELQLYMKRVVDVALSVVAIVLLFPILCAIACGVKISSPGPILFRQKRVGLDGKEFTFLKFRSMKHGSDTSVHEKFVSDLMALETNTAGEQASATPKPVYKMVNDNRITRFGAFIRRTSLDELPQLWNVVQGHMSLVGPRPPIPYEVDRYAPWHLERLMRVKPGISGLWQVEGRSRVSFNEMVRMDIRYSRNVNLWTDVQLMVRTVFVVLKMTGAR